MLKAEKKNWPESCFFKGPRAALCIHKFQMFSSLSDGSSHLWFSGLMRMKTLPWISSMEHWNGTRRMEWVHPARALNYCYAFSIERCLYDCFLIHANRVGAEDKLEAAVDTRSCKTDTKPKEEVSPKLSKTISTACCTSTSVSLPLCSHLCANKTVYKEQEHII